MQRQVKYQRNRRAKGLCGWGGCGAMSVAYYCAEHGERVKAKRKGRTNTTVYQKQRRAEGLCGYSGCSVQTGDDSYYCAGHSRVRRE